MELLGQIGVAPDEVLAADIDETPRAQENPRLYVRRMAREKAEALRSSAKGLLLSADTVVNAGRRILGKPESEAEARAFLELLSGRRHRVITAIALTRADRVWERLVETQVKFRPLRAAEIDDYIASDEWRGKAGGYAIQGRASSFIPWIQGSFTGVVGLPLAETTSLLTSAGYFGEHA